MAALKRCMELLESSIGDFKDPDFGPEMDKQGAFCIYWDGEPPSSVFPPAEELQWSRPKEWLDNPSFFDEDISSNDVI